MIISPFLQNDAAFFIKHQSFHGGTYWRRSQGQSKRRECSAIFASVESPAKALRLILQSPGIHQGPACFDALSAKLVERAGFEFCFTSGFSISAARLGLPDVGLISYGEMADQGNQITQAVSIPVIGDGDTGYGNSMNVKRTVKGYIKAGFAGIILEDQLKTNGMTSHLRKMMAEFSLGKEKISGAHQMAPKACGHTRGRKVVSREESIMRIKAAIDARKESGSDIIIIARTDSRQAISFEESLWRSQAFGDAGADVLFIDALASNEEMKAFCEIAPLIPKMANMLEGGGKTPILSPNELEELGFKIVAYPLSLIGCSIRAMEDALIAIKGGRIPPPSRLPSFEEVKEIIGFNDYYEEEKCYTIRENSLPALQRGYSSQGSDFIETSMIQNNTDERTRGQTDSVVVSVSPYLNDENSSNGSNTSLSRILSTTLRIKITGRDGMEKLDIRIPGGFLDRISNIIPALVGVNIKEKLEETTKKFVNAQKGVPFLDFKDAMGDRIQVFIE